MKILQMIAMIAQKCYKLWSRLPKILQMIAMIA